MTNEEFSIKFCKEHEQLVQLVQLDYTTLGRCLNINDLKI